MGRYLRSDVKKNLFNHDRFLMRFHRQSQRVQKDAHTVDPDLEVFAQSDW